MKGRIGRFSDGQERIEAHPEHERIGSFADGQRQRGHPDIVRIGRFSEGQEALEASAAHERVGCFSDGMEQTGRSRSRSLPDATAEREVATRAP